MRGANILKTEIAPRAQAASAVGVLKSGKRLRRGDFESKNKLFYVRKITKKSVYNAGNTDIIGLILKRGDTICIRSEKTVK